MKVEFMGWKYTLTSTRLVLLAIAAISVLVILLRLVTGFGLVTNLNDKWPWGLWIAFDVLTGVALAGGGYFSALIVHVLHQDKYKAVSRGAMLTSLLGYILVMTGLFVDIGQWFNFWRPFVSWGHSSVLFEVFWCISIYTTIQALELGEVVTERIGAKFHKYFKKVLPVLMIIGVIFPTLHQSSLGGLFLLAAHKLNALWWSPFLPLFFLMSSFFVGPAMICVESTLAGKAFKHTMPVEVLQGLAKIGCGMMVTYLALKIYDVVDRGAAVMLFSGKLQGNMFLAEMIFGIIVPVGIVFSKFGNSRQGLFIYGLLTSGGVILNRMNVAFTGMIEHNGSGYFPSVGEFAVSIGLIAIGCLVYCFVVENFNIFEHKQVEQDKMPRRASA